MTKNDVARIRSESGSLESRVWLTCELVEKDVIGIVVTETSFSGDRVRLDDVDVEDKKLVDSDGDQKTVKDASNISSVVVDVRECSEKAVAFRVSKTASVEPTLLGVLRPKSRKSGPGSGNISSEASGLVEVDESDRRSCTPLTDSTRVDT